MRYATECGSSNQDLNKTVPAPAPYKDLNMHYIDGKWCQGSAGKSVPDLNPYTQQPIFEFPLATQADIDTAFKGVKKAEKIWMALLPEERSAILLRAADIFHARREEIADWLVKEAGAPRSKAAIEVQSTIDVTREAATFPSRMEGEIIPINVAGKESRAYRIPGGTVSIIGTWNWPLQLSNRTVAPAIGAGNGVVLKPAVDAPVTGGTLLAKVYEEAGVPPGLISVVLGADQDIGNIMMTHPSARIFSFTGSTTAGKKLGSIAISAPVMKQCLLELGGNAPVVVLDDADIDLAVKATVFGRFLNQGQTCMSSNRLIVDAKVYDQFVNAFVSRVKALKYGDPSLPDTAVGPVINARQLKGLVDRVAKAKQDGQKLVVGGEAQGLVFPPHVFVDVDNDSELAQTEQFGPIAVIIKATDETHALEMANKTEFGLASAVFTQNEARGLRFALQVQAGMTHINDQSVCDIANCPFGGVKESGVGRFGGKWALDEFSAPHWITIQRQPRQYPF